jgi:hypothetical protein
MQRSPSYTPLGRIKNTRRRRSDAEPDHTLRGRARNRSESRSRSPILEGEDEAGLRVVRKRSQPPSRGWMERDDAEAVDGLSGGMRRQRSFPNLYKDGRGRGRGRQDSGAHEGEREAEDMQDVKSGALAEQTV